MEQLSHAVDRFTAGGYVHDLQACPEGLRVSATGRVYPPDQLVVDDVVRFEGETDPDDEVILFTLRSVVDPMKGTYVVAYGSKATAADAAVVRALGAFARSHDAGRGSAAT